MFNKYEAMCYVLENLLKNYANGVSIYPDDRSFEAYLRASREIEGNKRGAMSIAHIAGGADSWQRMYRVTQNWDRLLHYAEDEREFVKALIAGFSTKENIVDLTLYILKGI